MKILHYLLHTLTRYRTRLHSHTYTTHVAHHRSSTPCDWFHGLAVVSLLTLDRWHQDTCCGSISMRRKALSHDCHCRQPAIGSQPRARSDAHGVIRSRHGFVMVRPSHGWEISWSWRRDGGSSAQCHYARRDRCGWECRCWWLWWFAGKVLWLTEWEWANTICMYKFMCFCSAALCFYVWNDCWSQWRIITIIPVWRKKFQTVMNVNMLLRNQLYCTVLWYTWIEMNIKTLWLTSNAFVLK